MLGFTGTAARARQVLGARGRGDGVRRARVSLRSPSGAPPGNTAPDGPALGHPRHPCPGTAPLGCPPRPSTNLGAALQQKPGQGLASEGLPRAAPAGSRLRMALGTYLQRRRWERAASSAAPEGVRGAPRSARALRLFPETPPGGVRPTRLGRFLTSLATLLPRQPRAVPALCFHSAPCRARSLGAELEHRTT